MEKLFFFHFICSILVSWKIGLSGIICNDLLCKLCSWLVIYRLWTRTTGERCICKILLFDWRIQLVSVPGKFNDNYNCGSTTDRYRMLWKHCMQSILIQESELIFTKIKLESVESLVNSIYFRSFQVMKSSYSYFTVLRKFNDWKNQEYQSFIDLIENGFRDTFIRYHILLICYRN